LRTRPHTALVVHPDGTTAVVDGPTRR